MIIFNLLGLLIVLISMGVVYAIFWLLNLVDLGIFWYDREWFFAMPLVIILDLAYRKIKEKHWFHPHAGGHVFFLPVWVWGAIVMLIALPSIISTRGARRCDLATVTVVSSDGRSPLTCPGTANRQIIRSALTGEYYEWTFSGTGKLVCSCKAK